MKNCHGCEEETLNPHEDINKNESMEGGRGAGFPMPYIPLMGIVSLVICF
jgi:hypothetical protein